MYTYVLYNTMANNKVFTTLKNKQLHCIKLHTGLSDEGCSVPDEVENDEEGGLVNTNERVCEVAYLTLLKSSISPAFQQTWKRVRLMLPLCPKDVAVTITAIASSPRSM